MSYNQPAICVDGVSKTYNMYGKPEDRLKQMIVPRFQKLSGAQPKQYFQKFKALNNVSFDVAKGEILGLIGRNGSGKSTLLQIICGTLKPSDGSVKTEGRVAALLELGAGFNPDFTGRENVFLNGAILGLSKKEIQAKFTDVEEFADIGIHIDQPVKTYSSGMYVRLAFSVATAVDPQILVIDEALAVGDEAFQRKCIQRFEILREQGTTILLVSHSAQTIVQLCDRAIMVDGGEIIMDGHPNTVVANYQRMMDAAPDKAAQIREAICKIDGKSGAVVDAQMLNGSGDQLKENQNADKDVTEPKISVEDDWYDAGFVSTSTTDYLSAGAIISEVRIVDASDNIVNMLQTGRSYTIRYNILFSQGFSNIGFSTLIKSLNGVEIAGVASGIQAKTRLDEAQAGQVFEVSFKFDCRLKAGTYFVNSGAVSRKSGERLVLHRLVDAFMFKVREKPNSILTGIVDLGLRPEWKQIDSK